MILQVRSPKWFLIFFTAALLTTISPLLSIFVMGLHDFIRGALTASAMVKVFIFPAIIFGLIWYTRHFYYVVTATDSGLRSVGPFTRETRIEWGDITAVRTPRWRVPRNFTYIWSKTGKQIVIINGMSGYSELLDLIESKTAHVIRPRKLHDL